MFSLGRLTRHVVDDERVGHGTQLAQKLPEFLVFGVREVRVTGRRVLKCEHVDVRKSQVLLRASKETLNSEL